MSEGQFYFMMFSSFALGFSVRTLMMWIRILWRLNRGPKYRVVVGRS